MKIRVGNICICLLAFHMFLLIMNGTKYFSIGSRSQIYLLMILMSAVSVFSSKSKPYDGGVIVSTEKILTVLLSMYTIFSAFFVRPQYDRGTFLAAILLCVLIFFWTNNRFRQKQIETLERCYIFSALILALGIIIFRYQPYTDVSSSRMTIQSYTGEYYDVNFISAYIVVPTIFLFQKYFERKKRGATVIRLMIMLAAILITGSRTALGIVAIAVAFILWKQKKIGSHVLIAGIAVIALLPVMIQFLPEDIFSHYLKGINIFEDSRRMKDWMTGITLIAERPWLGHGLVSSHSLIVEHFDITWITVHNSYLVFIVNYGVIFGSFIIMLLFLPLYRLVKYKALYVYPLAYGMFLLSILLIEANFSDIMMVPICVFYAIANYYKEQYLKNRQAGNIVANQKHSRGEYV